MFDLKQQTILLGPLTKFYPLFLFCKNTQVCQGFISVVYLLSTKDIIENWLSRFDSLEHNSSKNVSNGVSRFLWQTGSQKVENGLAHIRYKNNNERSYVGSLLIYTYTSWIFIRFWCPEWFLAILSQKTGSLETSRILRML